MTEPVAIQIDEFRRVSRAALDELSSGVAFGPAWSEYAASYGHPAAVLFLLDALESAQRPPLGYVVLAKRDTNALVWERRVFPDRPDAERRRQAHHDAGAAGKTPDLEPEYVLGEVWEVQP
ncbi:hypothetical protein [Nocardia sp. Marseille-Q1738]